MIKRDEVVQALIESAEKGERVTWHTLRRLLVNGLGDRDREVFLLLTPEGVPGITASEISDHLDISVSHALNILYNLETMTLAKRVETHREDGLREFAWFKDLDGLAEMRDSS